MRWSEDGKAFRVAAESEISRELLEKVAARNYHTLIRRLYYYGFRKQKEMFYHPRFIRGQPSSIGPISRSRHSLAASSANADKIQIGPRYKIIGRKRARESI